MPMSSPQITTMFGLSALALDLAISISFRWSGWFRTCLLLLAARRCRVGEAKQQGEKGEQADADQDNGDGDNRRLLSFFGNAGDRRIRFTPQIANAPPVLPNRNEERQDSAGDQRKPQISRCVWKIGGVGSGCLSQMFEVLDDREAEADQRDGRTQPCHDRALEGKAGAQPGEMISRCCPDFESGRARCGM